jgi:hypothetical protein
MWFNSIDAIDYDSIVGGLLYEEMRRRFCKESSIVEATVVTGRSIERGQG